MEIPATANEVVSLVSTLRDLSRAMTQRIDNYRGNPQQLTLLKNELSNVEQKVSLCSKSLRKYQQAIETESLEFEIIDIRGMVQTLRHVDENVKEVEETLQRRRRRPFNRALWKANRTAESICEHVQVVRDMSVRLNEMNEKLKAVAKENDVFKADFSSVPKFRMPVYLDFSTPNTMEGQVKAKLLERLQYSPPDTQDMHAHVTAVVGVSGIGGVGKTTAIIGLAQDADVRKEFSDGGIYFLVVGKDVRAGNLVASLKEMVRRSGGKRRCEDIDINGSLESAALITSSWFAKRKALFICDDLWKTSTSEIGYLNALVGLLDESPESRMLISTRSSDIASETSSSVLFEPRSNTGRESLRMFLSSANLEEATVYESGSGDVVNEILELCGGVPLMLSIAGAQIRRRCGTPAASLKGLMRALKDSRLSLPKKQLGQYPSCFNQAVQASLRTIADLLEGSEALSSGWNEYSRSRTEFSGRIVDFVSDCFWRLCVLPRSARVSEEIIFGIWCITNKELGWGLIDCLVDFHLVLEFADAQGNPQFGLHDVLLDHCKKMSQVEETPKYELYHREFLSQAWKPFHRESSNALDIETTWDDWNRAIEGYWDPKAWECCRPWWQMLLCGKEFPETRNYLLGNVVRHLKESGRLAEAVGLVCHMGWTKVRVTYGNISAMNADFYVVENAIRSHREGEQDKEATANILSGISSIWDAVRRAWPVLLKNLEALPTHAYGYLLDIENQSPLVQRYLRSSSDLVRGVWLKPQDAFWRTLDSMSSCRVFRSAEYIVGVVMLSGSKRVIAATTNMLFWIDIGTMAATQEKLIRNIEKDESQISALTLCEREGILLIGFSTGELEVRNARNGSILRTILSEHDGAVTSLSVSTDGRIAVSKFFDSTIHMLDVDSGVAIAEPLLGHESTVTCVAISVDGRTVVSGSWDMTLRVWNVESGAVVVEPLRGHEDWIGCISISADGRMAVSGSDDKTVRVWDVKSGAAVSGPLLGHEGVVRCVSISADGKRVVSGSEDKTLRVWNIESGAAISDLLLRHERTVTCVALSADGRTVVSSCLDRTLRVWDVENRAGVVESLLGYDGGMRTLSISADGRTVVSASLDWTLRLWDLESGAAIGGPLLGHEGVVKCVSISADGRRVVSGSDDKTVRVWDVVSGKTVGEPLRGHEDKIRCVLMSADGRIVVSGSRDRTVRVWDVDSGAVVVEPLLGHEGTVTCVAISLDKRTVVSGSRDETVRVWDVENAGTTSELLRGHKGDVRCVSIVPDGRTIVSGSRDRTVRVWSRSNHWGCSYVCLLPSSWAGVFAYREGDELPGVMGRLDCPFGNGATGATFELIRPA